jgi:hypothetical protein
MKLDNTSTVHMNGDAGYTVKRSSVPGIVVPLTLGRDDADKLRAAFASEELEAAAHQAASDGQSPKLALARHVAAVLMDISASYVDWEVAYGHEQGDAEAIAYNRVASDLFGIADKTLADAGFTPPASTPVVHQNLEAANEEIARLRRRLAVHGER